MLLLEEFIKEGNWLFRWRSYLPLGMLVIVLLGFRGFAYPMGSHSYDLAWEMACLAVSLFGMSIRCYTIGRAPKGTSGRNTKRQVADTLNTTGMYSITRNPLYFGNFFMALGISMLPRLWWCSSIYVLAFWLYYERIIMAEERYLANKFGKEYEDYAARTPAFLPNLKLWQPAALPFSIRSVLRSEYSGFFGVITAFTVLELIGTYVAEGRVFFDPVWAVLFLVGFLVYITLRTLKKKTRLLHVEGRQLEAPRESGVQRSAG
jgi:protein-S-isoprenylcysteine O-methyltransferase Ste14